MYSLLDFADWNVFGIVEQLIKCVIPSECGVMLNQFMEGLHDRANSICSSNLVYKPKP